MARSVGIDLVDIAEIVGSLEQFGSRYLERVYTEQELVAYLAYGPASLAACFAAKEAAVKALAVGNAALPWHSIELLGPPTAPMLRLTGNARRLALERGASLDVSVTTTRDYALAVVISDGAEEHLSAA